jgi:hypothetical protein
LPALYIPPSSACTRPPSPLQHLSPFASNRELLPKELHLLHAESPCASTFSLSSFGCTPWHPRGRTNALATYQYHLTTVRARARSFDPFSLSPTNLSSPDLDKQSLWPHLQAPTTTTTVLPTQANQHLIYYSPDNDTRPPRNCHDPIQSHNSTLRTGTPT